MKEERRRKEQSKGTTVGHIFLLPTNPSERRGCSSSPRGTSPRPPGTRSGARRPPVTQVQLPHVRSDAPTGEIDGAAGSPPGRTLAPQIDGPGDEPRTMAKFRLRRPGAERRWP